MDSEIVEAVGTLKAGIDLCARDAKIRPGTKGWNWMQRAKRAAVALAAQPTPAMPQQPDDHGRPMTFWGGLAERQQGFSFQSRVAPWMQACFGPAISADTTERNHRFLEEALELVQACGATREDCLQLVDYVYGRPVGEPEQEVGGVMVTLAALCLAGGLDMHQAGETELARIWTKVEQIRAKQAGKPKGSPLPGKLSFIHNAAVPDGELWAIDKNIKIVGKIVEADLQGQGGKVR